MQLDAIVIGSGIGGLCTGCLLARHGRAVLVVEAHTRAGGAAHGFERRGFCFDTGPSFYCGLADPNGRNPLRLVLATVGETIAAVPYDPLAHYHFPEGSFPVYGDLGRYKREIARVRPRGAEEYGRFARRLLPIYEALREIPMLALRADLGLLPKLVGNYLGPTLRLATLAPDLVGSAGQILEREVRDPWVRRLVDLECFLLSGLPASETVAPEVAFMLGERDRSTVEYPLGGSRAIVAALVRGLTRYGGQLRLNSPVAAVLVEGGWASGVRLADGEEIRAPIVVSGASLWDTCRLLPPEAGRGLTREAEAMPAVASFMHLHLGIRSEGLDGLPGHHVVVGPGALDAPGNTCMISIPSVWDASLAPPHRHVVHVYSLEPFAGWVRDDTYEARKRERVAPLYAALARVIPDVHDRVELACVGTPLTHERFLRRDRGTYGPARMPRPGTFPGPTTPLVGLYRVGDTTLPGIGVPAVAASAILCTNALVGDAASRRLLNELTE
jgi:phytoene dehydrogenase-like protein